MTRVAPDWRPVVLRGVSPAIESQHDANARPGAPDWAAMRWRRRAWTGETPERWRPGAPPGAQLAKPRETWGHVLRIAAARAVLAIVIFIAMCGT